MWLDQLVDEANHELWRTVILIQGIKNQEYVYRKMFLIQNSRECLFQAIQSPNVSSITPYRPAQVNWQNHFSESLLLVKNLMQYATEQTFKRFLKV
jgi:hypothetical protein